MTSYGFALGGGGARGFALLGMIKFLEEKKIKPSVISGVSAGAVVGALLSAGKSAEEIHLLLKSQSFMNIGNPSLTTKGLLRFKGLRKLIKDNVKVSNIEDLEIPLHVVVTNLYSVRLNI